ncbi:endonuclease domain-containing protein [Novosphingobium sp.]|uniref:endonuclease domain-containing protein n=1 Tax=Novosphingobium sp. TaxID=1874826 RepID=UPI0035621C86
MSDKRLTPLARKLRKDPTEAEKRMWSRLRGEQLGVKFTRQFPIGNAIVDFACRRLKLVVELDGGQHADSSNDEARTRMIEAHGYHVVRYWNNDVLANTDGVLTALMIEIDLARNRT